MKPLFYIAIFIAAGLLVWHGFTDSAKPITDSRRDYRRIISLAPSFCETLVALGQGHRLVGVSSHCSDKSLHHLPRVGTFAEANLEVILRLKPDLVLAVPHAMALNTITQLRKNGIEVYATQPDSLADIERINLDLARKFDIEDKGLELNQQFAATFDMAKNSLLQSSREQKVLIAIADNPLVVAGRASFPSEVLERFGLKNMAADSSSSWPLWPQELLLSKPPDVMVITQGAEYWPQYQILFRNLGIDLEKSRIKFIIPPRAIFQSPSPLLLDDIKYFFDSYKDLTTLGFSPQRDIK